MTNFASRNSEGVAGIDFMSAPLSVNYPAEILASRPLFLKLYGWQILGKLLNYWQTRRVRILSLLTRRAFGGRVTRSA